MIEIIKGKEVSEGYEISSHMKGEATGKELKAIIKSMLKAFVDSTDDTIVISAIEDFVKERLG